MEEIPIWLKVFSGLLTLFLSIVATAIIVLQYFLQRNRWKLDLFEKRYLIYEKTKQYIVNIVQEGKVTREELFNFTRQTKDSEFLFGKDVNDYLKLLYQKSVELIFVTGKIQSNNMKKEEHRKVVDQDYELLSWFIEQISQSSKLFGRYLRIDKR